MAIQQNFPDEGPSLNLNFAGSRTLDPRITFTRTTSATYMGPDGLIKIAAANSPRFDHSYNSATGEIESLGLLIEEQRQNLLLRSEEFETTWSTTRTSVTTNAAAAPNGTTTAEKFIEDSTEDNSHFVSQSVTITNATTYTFSCFVKAAERFRFRLSFSSAGFGSTLNTSFNLQTSGTTASAGATASIVAYPGGWFRCIATATSTATTTSNFSMLLLSDVGSSGYTGDGTSGIFIWGAQLEVGAFPTSYIPTVASTVTRNQDRVLIDGERFLQWYNPVEGTFFCSTNDPRGTVVFGVGNTFDNTIYTTAGGSFSGIIRSGGSATSFVGTISNSGTSKVAFGVKTDNSALCINGVITGSSLTADMPINPIRLTLGASPWSTTASSNQVDGTISQLTYYPTRLPNNILQNLTR